MLRRKGGNTCESKRRFGCGKRIADGKDTRVEHTDDVARISLLHDLALGGHKLRALGQLYLFAPLHMEHIHAALKLSAADADEGDAVPVGLIHIGLDLEHECRKILPSGVDGAGGGIPRQGRGRKTQKIRQERLHPEVRERRAKEHRRQHAVAHLVQIEFIGRAVQQLDVLAESVVQRLRQQFVQAGVAQLRLDLFGLLLAHLARMLESEDLLFVAVIHALEFLA